MKKILITVMAVVMVIAMMGSAFAYFTDVRTSSSNILSAGTLTMAIQDNNEGPGAGPVSASFNSPVGGLAPGQTFTTDPITLQNTGSLDINRIYGRFSTTDADPYGTAAQGGIANHLILNNYQEWSSNGAWTPTAGDPEQTGGQDGQGFWTESFGAGNANAYLSFWGLATDGSISLADLIAARNSGSGGNVTDLLFFDNTPTPFVPPLLHNNGTVQIKFTFTLTPETNNDFQGASANFRVDFIGTQDTTYPDTNLNTYITPGLLGP